MHRLDSVRVQNYRSIADSGVVDFNEDVTSLIGENESGKTNFLNALHSFNFDENYEEDDLCLYNKEERRRKKPSEIPIVTGVFDWDGGFKLSQENKRAEKIKITKYFDGHYTVGFVLQNRIKKVEVSSGHYTMHNYADEILNILEEMENDEDYNSEIDKRVDINNYKSIQQELRMISQNPPEKNEFITIINTLVQEIDQMRNQANNSQQALADARNEVQNIQQEIKSRSIYSNPVQNIDVPPSELSDAIEALHDIPRFVIHKSIEELDDQIEIGNFEETENRTFSNLLKLSGLEIEDLSQDERRGRFRRTKPASAEVSGIINESWSQETVELELDIDGDILSVYLTDDQASEGAFTRPSERSKGFQYFLSFYTNFTAESKGELKDTILLLDDPGVYLHPSGKKDLLDTLEQLSDTNQVIYTTHSPFLINQDRLSRIRIVDRSPNTNGTTIESEFHQNDSDALAPVRTALGAGIADSLFGSHSNILVEGPSDKIFINSLSNYFRRRNRADEALDPDEISVINVGGADRMSYFARLIDAEGYEYVILLDNDQRGRERRGELESEHDIDSEKIVLLSDIVPSVDGFDSEIEDLFDPEFFHEAVTEAYSDIFNGDELEEAIEDIPEKSIANKYERIFGEKLGSSFDKVMVAKHISTIVQRDDCSDDTVGEETIENFRNLFTGVKQRL